jgi:molybdate transport system substrate-binding protein
MAALTIFAGSASKPALDELAKLYQEQKGTSVGITYGGSGAVLTQFAQEQYGDIYIPGSDDFMDKAEKKGAVLQDTRTVLVYLVPAINVPKGNPKQIRDLADLAKPDMRVVIGEPSTVCLGDIAQAMLEREKLWEKVKPRIANYASSCENVLQALLLGEADAVIGWDVFGRQHLDKVDTITLPADLARPRSIPASVIRWSKQADAAKAFIGFLASDESKAVWEKHGYTPEPPAAAPAKP